MNHRDRIKRELENDRIWKAICASASPEDLEQVNAVLDELFAVAGRATEGLASNLSKDKITDEQVAAAVGDRRG
jgi:hypothetical protein